MISILARAGTLWGRVAVGAGIVASLVALRAWDISKQRAIGAEKLAGAIEKATNETVEKAGRAGRKSADSSARGVRNPYTRPD